MRETFALVLFSLVAQNPQKSSDSYGLSAIPIFHFSNQITSKLQTVLYSSFPPEHNCVKNVTTHLILHTALTYQPELNVNP